MHFGFHNWIDFWLQFLAFITGFLLCFHKWIQCLLAFITEFLLCFHNWIRCLLAFITGFPFAFITGFIFGFRNWVHNWIWNNVLSSLELIKKKRYVALKREKRRQRKPKRKQEHRRQCIEYVITDVRDCIA